MKQPKLAVPVLEQAIADFGDKADAYDIGSTRYHLAMALSESGDRGRALAIAKEALADLGRAQSGDGRTQYRETLTKLIGDH